MEWMDSVQAERDLGALIDSRPDMSQQSAHMAKKANGTLTGPAIVRSAGPGQCSALVIENLKCCVQFWAQKIKKEMEGLERVQRRATRLVRGLESRGTGVINRKKFLPARVKTGESKGEAKEILRAV